MPLKFTQFETIPNLHYGFSERADGSMHRHLETKNRSRYFQEKRIQPGQVVTADLIHGADVTIVDESFGGRMVQADALVTDKKNLFLSATGADCFLIYIVDPKQRIIGMVHAGWRGLLAGIIKNTVDVMVEKYQIRTQELLVGISPSIRICHFEISPDDKPKYAVYPEAIQERDGKTFVDLCNILKVQLAACGVPSTNIEDSGECTYCNPEKYFSYRRDKPTDVQPMVGYIGFTE